MELSLSRNFTNNVGVRLPANRGRGPFNAFESMNREDWRREDASTFQTGNAPMVTGLAVANTYFAPTVGGGEKPHYNRYILPHQLLFISKGIELVKDNEYRPAYASRAQANVFAFPLHCMNHYLREATDGTLSALEELYTGVAGGTRTVPEHEVDREYNYSSENRQRLSTKQRARIPYSTARGVLTVVQYMAPNCTQSNFMSSNTANTPGQEFSADSGATMIAPTSKGSTYLQNVWRHVDSGQHLFLLLKRVWIGTGLNYLDKSIPAAEQLKQSNWSAFQFVPYRPDNYLRQVDPEALCYLGMGGCWERAVVIYVGQVILRVPHAPATEYQVLTAAGLPRVDPLKNQGQRTNPTLQDGHMCSSHVDMIKVGVNPFEHGDYAFVHV